MASQNARALAVSCSLERLLRPGAFDLHGLVVVGDVGERGAGGLGFAQVVQGELGLLAGLVLGQRLGEEIGAHLDAHLPGANGILEEELVGGKRTFRGASVADAGESELHAGVGNGSPIDVVALVLRHIDAPA